MSACQKHSGNERSAEAVGNTREHVPALHPLLSLLFSPLCSLLPHAPLCYLTGPPCFSFPSLSLLCSFPLSLSLLWICPLFFCTPISYFLLLSLFFPWLLLFSFVSFGFCWNLWRLMRSIGINECVLDDVFHHKQPHPKLGISRFFFFFSLFLSLPIQLSLAYLIKWSHIQ